ncbi:Fumarate reductase cytochrome b subunit [Halioglobus japonicus]|nr:Fumarate reductase cytochrome b subunit [Halioglobus japonicus]
MPQAMSPWPARMDLLQSLSGLLLVLFIWSHMFFESSILLGEDAMYQVSRMFEGEPFFGKPYPLIVSGVGITIFVLVAVHAILALRKFPGNSRQYRLLHQHMGAIRHPDTTLWYAQVATGFCLFFLIPAHLYTVITQPENIGPYASSDRVWSERFWIVYALLLLTVHAHAAIGMYRLFMKWYAPSGVNAKQTRARMKVAMWCILVFFTVLGSASLLTYMRIGYQHTDSVGERYKPATVQDKGH